MVVSMITNGTVGGRDKTQKTIHNLQWVAFVLIHAMLPIVT